MGAMNGGIPLETIKSVMRRYLSDISDLDVEVYDFDPDAPDPLYKRLQDLVLRLSPREFAECGHFANKTAATIYSAMETKPPSLCRLIEAASLGESTSDKLYSILIDPRATSAVSSLFPPP